VARYDHNRHNVIRMMTYGTIDSCLSRASTGNPSHQLGNPSACWQVTCFCALSTRQRLVSSSISSTTDVSWNRSPMSTLATPSHDRVFSPPLGLSKSSGPDDDVDTETDAPSSREFEGPSYNMKSSSPSANSRGIPRPCCFQERGEDYGLG
jgi:hypothetical protein